MTWFSSIIKPEFFEINDIKKQIFRKENPINRQNTICSICGFLLDINVGWFDFIVKCEHLFPNNINSGDELEEMDVETEEKYTGIIYRPLEYYPLFEKAIKNGDICDEVRSFLLENLKECYSTIGELREDICHV